MANYRLYELDPTGQIRARSAFRQDSDAEALAIARSSENPWGIELWCGPRLVKRLKPPSRAS